MTKLNSHARIGLAVVAMLLLGGCDMPRTYRSSDADRLNVADVNARNAINRVNDLESRVEDLERRLR